MLVFGCDLNRLVKFEGAIVRFEYFLNLLDYLGSKQSQEMNEKDLKVVENKKCC